MSVFEEIEILQDKKDIINPQSEVLSWKEWCYIPIDSLKGVILGRKAHFLQLLFKWDRYGRRRARPISSAFLRIPNSAAMYLCSFPLSVLTLFILPIYFLLYVPLHIFFKNYFSAFQSSDLFPFFSAVWSPFSIQQKTLLLGVDAPVDQCFLL